MLMLREAGAAGLFTTGAGGYGSRLKAGTTSGRQRYHISTLENHPRDIHPLLPAVTVEFGIEMLLHRPADAEIGHQCPACRHIERAMDDVWLEDGDPA